MADDEDSLAILVRAAKDAVRNKSATVDEAKARAPQLNATRDSIKRLASNIANKPKKGDADIKALERLQKANADLKAAYAADERLSAIHLHVHRDRAPKMQVAFLLDGTSSMDMGAIMTQVKNSIATVVADLHGITNLEVELGLVVYRDYGDKERFVVRDFTTIDCFCETLATQEATGGSDAPEDVLGGFDKMLKSLTWDADSIHACLWCCDAPGHGMLDTSVFKAADRFPDADPDGRTVDAVCDGLAARRIFVVFMRVKAYTDKMIGSFFDPALTARGMPKVATVQLEDAGNIATQLRAALITSATFSVTVPIPPKPAAAAGVPAPNNAAATATHSLDGPGGRRQRKVPRATDGHGRASFRTIKGRIGVYPPMSINTASIGPSMVGFLCTEMILKWTDGQQREVAREFFEAGGVRFAYFGRSERGPLVAKDFQIAKMDTLSFHNAEMKGIACAAYIATVFRDRLKLSESKFRYVRCAVLERTDVGVAPVSEAESRFYTIEEALDAPRWKKMNSNNGYVDNSADFALAQAFSHFSFHVCDGLLMVLDLQGVVTDGNFVLSDPAVQTADRGSFANPTNVGEVAMRKFFKAHRCNEFCKALKLPPMVS